MSRHLKKEEWVKIIHLYKTYGTKKAAIEYIALVNNKSLNIKTLRNRIKNKSILLDNKSMTKLKRKKGSGRPLKRDDSDIPAIIDGLNEEQKREIIEHWIKEQRNKNSKNKKETLNSIISLDKTAKAKISKMHRTSFYKLKIDRKYKFDYLKFKVLDIFNSSKGIYGSRKIAQILASENLLINDRTLRHYMVRWGIFTQTRKKKRKSEKKNTKVKYEDLVKRNFNPSEDNIVATDVSFIPAMVIDNFIYLSAIISHKTKKIESWELSKDNNTKLVIDTIKSINRKNFILHSDHGTQYSSIKVLKKLKKMNAKTSMSRVGNSLDNREIEYFFGCLKGEYLNKIFTKNMSFEEIHNHISWYIDWYNNERIQKRLNWKTPAYVADVINNNL